MKVIVDHFNALESNVERNVSMRCVNVGCKELHSCHLLIDSIGVARWKSENAALVKQLRQVEGTVILHIDFTIKQDQVMSLASIVLRYLLGRPEG